MIQSMEQRKQYVSDFQARGARRGPVSLTGGPESAWHGCPWRRVPADEVRGTPDVGVDSGSHPFRGFRPNHRPDLHPRTLTAPDSRGRECPRTKSAERRTWESTPEAIRSADCGRAFGPTAIHGHSHLSKSADVRPTYRQSEQRGRTWGEASGAASGAASPPAGRTRSACATTPPSGPTRASRISPGCWMPESAGSPDGGCPIRCTRCWCSPRSARR